MSLDRCLEETHAEKNASYINDYHKNLWITQHKKLNSKFDQTQSHRTVLWAYRARPLRCAPSTKGSSEMTLVFLRLEMGCAPSSYKGEAVNPVSSQGSKQTFWIYLRKMIWNGKKILNEDLLEKPREMVTFDESNLWNKNTFRNWKSSIPTTLIPIHSLSYFFFFFFFF